jgi:hypothetical protein
LRPHRLRGQWAAPVCLSCLCLCPCVCVCLSLSLSLSVHTTMHVSSYHYTHAARGGEATQRHRAIGAGARAPRCRFQVLSLLAYSYKSTHTDHSTNTARLAAASRCSVYLLPYYYICVLILLCTSISMSSYCYTYASRRQKVFDGAEFKEGCPEGTPGCRSRYV